MTPYLGEFFGTFLLMLMGGCVNANLDLARTKGSGAGWILMSWGWGLSVFLGVYTAIELGGERASESCYFHWFRRIRPIGRQPPCRLHRRPDGRSVLRGRGHMGRLSFAL